ncbi:MAG: hypothetical protein JWO06_3598 [Bacteroidota bacterium]|nr:hypothetical protein [Bacteroidota bacterium]
MVNNAGKVTIGDAASTNNPADLRIRNRDWLYTGDPTAPWYNNPVLYAEDQTPNVLAMILNTGNATNSSGAMMISTNSLVMPTDIPFNPAFGIIDNNPAATGPILAVTGQGTVSMGVAGAIAQVDIGKNSSLFDGTGLISPPLEYLFHIGDNSTGNYMAVDQAGFVGIGTLNSGNAITEITNIGWSMPELMVDNGSETAGVGMDPVGTSSTLGIQAHSTNTCLDIYENSGITGWNGQLRYIDASNGNTRHLIGDNYDNGHFEIFPRYDLWAADMSVAPAGLLNVIGNQNITGYLSIGDVTTPSAGTITGYNLYVQHGIMTERVKVAVKTTGDWTDYVFDKKYKLMSIEDLEKYVNKNKHLPDVPSADEVVKNGVDLGSMDAKLLGKIEELSLYVIAQQKEIDKLKKHIK